jgi:hypothetical protein
VFLVVPGHPLRAAAFSLLTGIPPSITTEHTRRQNVVAIR